MTHAPPRNSVLVLGALLCGLAMVLPRGAGAEGVYVAIACLPPVLGAVTMRRRRSGVRAWWFLVAGSTLVAAGEMAEIVVAGLGGDLRTERTTDLLFLGGYAIQLVGVMYLVQDEVVTSHRSGWFDAGAVGAAVGIVVWGSLYGTLFGTGETAVVDLLTRFGGAIVGIALVAMSWRLLAGFRHRHAGYSLLCGAFTLQFAMDSVAALWERYTPGDRFDTAWSAGYVLLAAAMVSGRKEAAPDTPSRAAGAEINHALTVQAAAALIAMGVIVVESAGAVPTANLVVWVIGVLVIGAVTRVRVAGLLRLVGQASASENQLRLSAMVASSHDAIGLADPDGTIRFLSDSMECFTGVPAADCIGRRLDTLLVSTFTGLDDLLVRESAMAAGDRESWQCEVKVPGHTGAVVDITVTNQVDDPTIRGWVVTVHDITERTRLDAELRHQALHDSLTGLANRTLLFDRVTHALERNARGDRAPVSVIVIDLDGFKAVNDRLGHAAGDELLGSVAERLRSTMRPGDTVARLGSDEFAVLVEDGDPELGRMLAQRALDNLALPVDMGDVAIAVQANAGVAASIALATSVDAVELLRAADIALQAAKRSSTERVAVFRPEMYHAALEELELRLDLSSALERRELALVYQPIVDAATGRPLGAEALLRWNHPTRGTISPTVFVPIAERAGLITEIGAWVLETACREAADWPSGIYVSVNVAAPQWASPTFVDGVAASLRRSGLHPRHLLLEVTESMTLGAREHTRAAMDRLRARGIRIAIDDFGTGYSSLSYLGDLSADVIKIDRSFVSDLPSRPDHQSLTRAILAMADGLGMTTIAEGVETSAERDFLVAMGCRSLQGYLFARPMPAVELRRFLEEAMFATRRSVPSTTG